MKNKYSPANFLTPLELFFEKVTNIIMSNYSEVLTTNPFFQKLIAIFFQEKTYHSLADFLEYQ